MVMVVRLNPIGMIDVVYSYSHMAHLLILDTANHDIDFQEDQLYLERPDEAIITGLGVEFFGSPSSTIFVMEWAWM